MAFRKHLSGQKGFTLIELLVVVAILGILATVAVPRVMGAIDNARERKALADLTTIRNALERFYLEYGVFPVSLAELVDLGDFGPDFNFTNSYGNFYFYAVRWEGDHDAPAANCLKDYILADPGQNPQALAAALGVAGLLELKGPEGSDPREAVPTGFYWGWDNTGAMAVGDNLVDCAYQAVSISNVVRDMGPITLTLIGAAKPAAAWIVYTGN